MASVRMSADLRQRIWNKAYALFKQPYERAEKALAEDYGDRLMTEVWEDKFKYYTSLIPDDWCMEMNDMRGWIKGKYKGEDKKEHIEFSLIKNYKIPAISKFIVYGDEFDLETYEPSQELFDEYCKYQARKERVANERIEFVQKISQLLLAHLLYLTDTMDIVFGYFKTFFNLLTNLL